MANEPRREVECFSGRGEIVHVEAEQMDEQSGLKRAAAERAVDFLQSGMTVGLGAGSTAEFALRRLGELTASGQLTAQARHFESLGARVQRCLNREGVPFRTDEGHLILDCAFGPIERPGDLAALLEARVGIVEHGLFLHIATDVLIGTADGVRHLSRNDQAVQR